MDDFADFRDRDVERVVDALREAYVRSPHPRVASAHMVAIVTETAPLRLAADAELRFANRLNRHPTRRFRMTTKRLALLPAALVLAFLGTAGLAVAGVNLPDTARAPFDAVGLQLPNQSRADDVHAVIDSTAPGDRGCEFGHAVAAAASQGRTHAPASACENGGGEASAQSQGAAHSEGAGEQGESQANAAQQPEGIPPTPPAGREFGQSTAADAQDNASTDQQAFGDRTSQGAQDLTPETPPASAGEQGGETGPSNAGQGQAAAAGSPGGSHIP